MWLKKVETSNLISFRNCQPFKVNQLFALLYVYKLELKPARMHYAYGRETVAIKHWTAWHGTTHEYWCCSLRTSIFKVEHTMVVHLSLVLLCNYFIEIIFASNRSQEAIRAPLIIMQWRPLAGSLYLSFWYVYCIGNSSWGTSQSYINVQTMHQNMRRAQFIINNGNHNTMDWCSTSTSTLLVKFLSFFPQRFFFFSAVPRNFGWTKINDGVSIWMRARTYRKFMHSFIEIYIMRIALCIKYRHKHKHIPYEYKFSFDLCSSSVWFESISSMFCFDRSALLHLGVG